MKKRYFILYAILSLLALKSPAQNTSIPVKKGQVKIPYLGEYLIIKPKNIDQLKKTALIYRYQMDSLAIKLNKKDSLGKYRLNFENTKEFEKLISENNINLDTIFKRRDNLDKKVFYNNRMINILFADEVVTYATSSSDLSLNRYYAGLDSEDASFSFAVNYNSREKNTLKPLRWLLSAGFKATSEEKFATIFKNGKFENNDLAVTGKVTWIGRGSIAFSSTEISKEEKEKKETKENLYPEPKPESKPEPVFKRTEIIRNFRRELLEHYETELKKYAEGDFSKDLDSLNLLYNKKYNQKEDIEKKTEEFIESKYAEYYGKIAGEEINYMKKNKLYRYLTSWWVTFDFNAPIGKKTYTTAVATESPTTAPIKFYQLKGDLTFTKFRKYSNGQSIYATARFSAFNNNNIMADELEPSTFQTVYTQSPTQQAIVTEDKAVYILPSGFQNFVTGSIKIEVVNFILDWIGISPAIEKNFGQYYHPLNWKIGIPLSLKDKDGKASVNLEPQYKKINNKELYGISVSFFLGKFLN